MKTRLKLSQLRDYIFRLLQNLHLDKRRETLKGLVREKGLHLKQRLSRPLH